MSESLTEEDLSNLNIPKKAQLDVMGDDRDR
jgi:hypothetical protein